MKESRNDVGIGTEILKVDTFLNHQIDVELTEEIGQEFARIFKDCGATKVLTVEASGVSSIYATKHFDDSSASRYSCTPFSFIG